MKRLVVVGLLALGVVLSVQAPAQGWWRLKVGSTWHLDWSCGNNSLLWHLYRNGQVPEAHEPVYVPTFDHAPMIPSALVVPHTLAQVVPPAPVIPHHSSADYGYAGTAYPASYQMYQPTASSYYPQPAYYTPTNWYSW